ncbi:hypothetical protein GWK47_029956 [Chionoecetes opilio]|uniref:Uncharacterized protein n=1 Tax=Chionoecetes opilio TaxID=41210 RepID=A0A8J5D5E6_CHIOP|nr:hypothetical protein GWK47_029956 [Chionoecetes opilio]
MTPSEAQAKVIAATLICFEDFFCQLPLDKSDCHIAPDNTCKACKGHRCGRLTFIIMGTGLGTGRGTGKGVKGSWRVSVFLLLLTGWQAVLLPWAPLLLKDVGFPATYVGVLSGGTTMAASVGVALCLRAMRRSRSGAMRRLLLWLMLATAAVLQGCGAGLALRHLSRDGIMPSCVSGWLFAPTTSVLLLNNVTAQTSTTASSSNALPSQQPHKLTIPATTTQSPSPSLLPPNVSHVAGTTAKPYLSHNSTLRPTPINSTPITTTTTTTTSTTTTSTSITTTLIPAISLIKPPTTTMLPAATIPTVTTTPRHATAPPVTTSTIKYQGKVPLNSSFNTEGALTSGESSDSKGWEYESTDTGEETAEAPHKALVHQGKHKAAHKPQLPAPAHEDRPENNHNSKAHLPYVSPKKAEQDNNFRKVKYRMNHKSIQPQGDNDYLASQEYSDDDDDDASQEVGKYDNSDDSDKEMEDDYEDDHLKLPNDHRKTDNHFRSSFGKLPQSSENAFPAAARPVNFPSYQLKSLQQNVPPKFTANFHKPYIQGTQNNHENSFRNSHHTDLFTSDKRDQYRWSAPVPDDQERLSYSYHSNHHPQKHLLREPKSHRRHLPSRQIKDPADGIRQGVDNDLQKIISGYTNHGRNRRDLSVKETKSYVHDTKVTTNETKLQHHQELKNMENLLEVKSGTVQAGVAVAVLLVLGGLAGAGVEAAVAKLWHCIVHGYDENGVSHDVLQSTITHTFHLSTYGNHKTWTGITSAGWVTGASVVSILTCLAGAGGGGYGGLLGMHLALGMGALFLLLVLPIPYGSIDPPRTRRPLSLYLDDEVLREGVRRLTFHIWVFVNGSLAALSLTFSLWLLQEITAKGWLVSSQACAVGMTLVCESLALHTQQRLVTRWGLHGLMGVCQVSLVLHYGIMWVSRSVGMVVVAHAGMGVAMAFLWVAVKHNALLLATVSDQEREAWASWWCWRLGVSVGAAVWGAGVSGAGEKVRPLLLPATLITAILATFLCVTAVLSRRVFSLTLPMKRNSRAMRRVYHTLDLDIGNDEIDEEENDTAEDDWLVKRARKEGITL